MPLGRHQPDVARELFIRHALVQGEWHTRHRFFETNRRLLEEAEELEHRARRHDIVVDEETLFDFYDARVPADVVSGAHFDTWWKQERRTRPDLLDLRPLDAGARPVPTRCARRLPGPVAGGRADAAAALPLRARPRGRRRHHRRPARDPEHRRRGAVHLERARPAPRPGHRPDPLAAQAAAGQLRAGARRRAAVPRGGPAGRGAAGPRAVALPALAHRGARPRGRVGPDQGARPPAADVPRARRRTVQEVGVGKDLEALKEPLRPSFDRAMRQVADESGVCATGQTEWTFGTIEPSFTQTRAGHEVHGFPALVDEGSTVGLRVAASADEQEAHHRLGVRRLLLLAAARHRRRSCSTGWTTTPSSALAASPYPNVRALVEDCVLAAVGELVDQAAPVRDPEAFAALVERARAELPDAAAGGAAAGAPRAGRVATGREVAARTGGDGDAARDDRPARPARPAGAPGLRRRGGAVGAAGVPALPPGDGGPARAARGPGPRPRADGPRRRAPAGLAAPGRRARPTGVPWAPTCAGCGGCSRSTASASGPSSSAPPSRSRTRGSARRWADGLVDGSEVGPGRLEHGVEDVLRAAPHPRGVRRRGRAAAAG